MSDSFDPYYIWLGIPPEDQPPHHYRLLGIELFEANLEVIEGAANRQMAYLQELSAGDDHVDKAQQLLGELSRARVCLLNQEKKKAYDKKLRAGFDSLAPVPETQAPKPAASSAPLMPPQIGKTTPNRPATGDDSPVATKPKPQQGRSPAGSRTKTKKRQSILWIVLPAIVIVALSIFAALQFIDDQTAQEEDSRKAEAEIARVEAERIAKEKAEAKAKEEEARIAKEKAEAKAKEEARIAKEKAEAKAKEEEARKAQELRDNPEKLLESKGFERKGKKWVFAKEWKLKLVTKELISSWKLWQKNRPQNDVQIKQQLEEYNRLLLASFENRAMRLAVREDLLAALEDPDVAAALGKFNVKTTELNKSVKALQKPDSKLRKEIPKKLPVIPGEKAGHFYAALIINEKESVIVHVDKATMASGDAPDLFILPRESQRRANLPIAHGGQKVLDPGYSLPLIETTVENMRLGLKQTRLKAYFIPTNDEAAGVPWNAEQTYRGKIGEKAWQLFFEQLQPAKVGHSQAAITAARKKLDAYQPDQKKNK